MSWRGFLMVALAALTTVAANLLMRAGVLQAGGIKLTSAATVLPQLIHLGKQPLFVLGMIFYALAAVVWFAVISTEQLSTAYPLLVSITFVLVTAGSVLFFGERVSLIKSAGIVWILAGIWIVAHR
jgi:multidrug transporter EmrE-like cation transporter